MMRDSEHPPERGGDGGGNQELDDIEWNEWIESRAQRRVQANRGPGEKGEPHDPTRKDDRKAARHRKQGREVTSIEPLLRRQ